MHFDATEENKLIYTSIFKEYQGSIENFLTKALTEAVENFSMQEFMS